MSNKTQGGVLTGKTSRRVLLEAILGLGATAALYGSLDASAWTAYEAVEEAWISGPVRAAG